MAFKLTKSKVDNISHPDSGQVFYRDSYLTGFGLRVGKSTKAYCAEKRINSKTVRVTIGTHGQITTEQARKETQRLLLMMTTGQNPADEKK
jgi:preprotein translocase subunit SecD